MPRRPPITRAQAAAAVDRIVARRAGARDPDLDQLGDHPEQVAGYVHRHRRVPDAVIRADVVDALLLCDAMEDAVDQHRLRLLYAARAAGMSFADLQGPLRQNHRQGVLGVIRRLEAANAGGTKDAAVVYAARRAKQAEGQRASAAAAAVEGVARVLVDAADRLPADLGEDLAEIRAVLGRAWRGEDVAELLAARLRLLIGDLEGVEVDTKLRAVLVDGAQWVRR